MLRRALPALALCVAAGLAVVLGIPPAGSAQVASDQARALLGSYREDITRIDRARDLLEAAVARDETDVRALVQLSRAWYL